MAVEQSPQCSLWMQSTPAGPGAVCIAVAGELDLNNADRLVAQVHTTLFQRRPASLLLDLNRLEFIDVAGVRTLYRLHADAEAADCTLVISHAPRTTRWILSVLGLDELFAMPALRRRRAEPGS